MVVENIEVFNIEGALRGMRNPMNSWNKSDSKKIKTDNGFEFIIGDNDKMLANKLIKAGSEHRKFMRQIMVCFDITAPLYIWKEFDTYQVGKVTNSTSTMHKIQSKQIVLDDFEIDDIEEFEFLELDHTINACENYRKKFLDCGDKKYWKALIRLLPESYLQKRTVTLNFENLYSIVRQRRGHKLTEWKTFIDAMRNIPYANDFVFFDYKNN